MFKIAEYDEISAKIDEVKEVANFLPDVTTSEGYEKSKRVSLDIGKIKTKLEKARKDKKDHYLKGGREVDSQAKLIMAKLDVIQKPHLEAYKELDNLKKQREQERKDKLEVRVEYMRLLPESMAESCSEEIMSAMNHLNSEECLDFYEYTEKALKARNSSKDLLAGLYAKKLKEEQDAEELEVLRKKQVEQDQKDRDERIKREIAEKFKADKVAAEEREKNLIADMTKAKKEALEAAEKAKQDAIDAAENARLEEIARQEQEAENERQAKAKREANKKHIGNILREAKEAIMRIGLSETEAKKVVLAIRNNEITNVTINY